jgi:hypothetical protein
MERRLFEDLIESDVVKHTTSQGKTTMVSIVLHTVLVVLILVVPLLMSDEIPEPTSVVKAFFVERAPRPRPCPPPPTWRPSSPRSSSPSR